MHHVALQLAPVLAAEKSKTPFYIAGGLLVVWALVLSLGIGGSRPEFPTTSQQQRGVIAVTAVLVLVTAAMALITSGTPAKSAAAANAAATTPANETAPSPEVTSTTSTTASTPEAAAPEPTTTAATTTKPTATTGTPAPSSSPAAKKPAKKPAAKPATTSLSLAASTAGALSYNTKTLSAKAGTVTITMANMSPVEHNVTIAEGTKVLGATPTFAGGSKTLTLKLKPGKYTFYCSVPGHRPAGMEGTLTVS
jgi:plastocyanin